MIVANACEEGLGNLKGTRQLMKDLNLPLSIKECGVDEQVFMSKLRELSENAHDDQCTGANPRYPKIAEIKEMYLRAYYGK